MRIPVDSCADQLCRIQLVSCSIRRQNIVEFGPGAEKISQSAAQLPLAAKAMVQCADTSQERLGVVSDAACTRPSLCGDADQATMRSTRRIHQDRAHHVIELSSTSRLGFLHGVPL